MWPIRDILPHIPEHLRVCENPDFVRLRCCRCGWVIWYSALGPTADEIERIARDHSCPQPEGM